MFLTTLPPCLPASYCLDDSLHIGTAIDAITGRIKAHTAIKFKEVCERPKEPNEPKVCFYSTRQICDVQKKEIIGFSGSIMFPYGGHTQRIFDFCGPSWTSASVMLIIFDWEEDNGAMTINEAELTEEACGFLETSCQDTVNGTRFRRKYGDYFVARIAFKNRFTIVW